MNKIKLFIVLSMFFLSTAQAVNMSPAVGDEAEYLMEWPLAGEGVKSKLIYRLTAFDKSSDLFKLEINQDGQISSFDISANDLAQSYFSSDILKNCKKIINGRIETIVVPAGQFKTCAYETQTNVTNYGWSGTVPFNLVRLILKDSDGTYLIQTLLRFQKN